MADSRRMDKNAIKCNQQLGNFIMSMNMYLKMQKDAQNVNHDFHIFVVQFELCVPIQGVLEDVMN